jgi:GH25 family lysozyme M1 (1,4-beta-N-acetylmuramidase)
MSGSTKGVDVSTWQHPYGDPIDWEEVAASGHTFALVKVSQGTGYLNPWATRDLDDARAAGLLVGAYHYFELGPPPNEQAAHFVRALMGQRLDLGVWLDWEPPPLPPFTATGYLDAFTQACDDGRPGCGLYCDLAWLDVLKQAGKSFGRLWLADWTAERPNEGQLIWQDAIATVPGIGAPVDVDVLTSTRAANLPTAPAPKPSAATVRSAVPASKPVEVEEEKDGEAQKDE